jgi:hypothetical protein
VNTASPLRAPRNVKTDKLAGWQLFLFAYIQMGVIETLGTLFHVRCHVNCPQGHSSPTLSRSRHTKSTGKISRTRPIFGTTQTGLLSQQQVRRVSCFGNHPHLNVGKKYELEDRQWILREAQTCTWLAIVIVQVRRTVEKENIEVQKINWRGHLCSLEGSPLARPDFSPCATRSDLIVAH